jgi:hypothetical protein
MKPTADQILKAKYQNYLLERADRQEAKGKPMLFEVFKHYMKNFTSDMLRLMSLRRFCSSKLRRMNMKRCCVKLLICLSTSEAPLHLP